MRNVKVVAVFMAVFLVGSGILAESEVSVFTPRANWLMNRCSDFMDVFALGVGVTTENEIGGPIPPSIGLYAEATTFLNAGIITHHGVTAEIEGRGAGAYSESRTLLGLGPYRAWKINQGDEAVNFYKDPVASRDWAERMERLRFQGFSRLNAWLDAEIGSGDIGLTEVDGVPAKAVIHQDQNFHSAFLGMPRGWQAWEYIGVEAAVCEPFLTHLGVTLRAGFDPSEVFDFVLGFLCIDFKKDDLRGHED